MQGSGGGTQTIKRGEKEKKRKPSTDGEHTLEHREQEVADGLFKSFFKQSDAAVFSL